MTIARPRTTPDLQVDLRPGLALDGLSDLDPELLSLRFEGFTLMSWHRLRGRSTYGGRTSRRRLASAKKALPHDGPGLHEHVGAHRRQFCPVRASTGGRSADVGLSMKI